MANSSVFRLIVGALLPIARARNAEGVPVYVDAAKACVAAGRCHRVPEPDLLRERRGAAGAGSRAVQSRDARVHRAECALHRRERGHMKDMPALLLAMLAPTDAVLMEAAFYSGRRHAAHAADVRADRPLRRDRSQVPRLGAEALRPALARCPRRRRARSSRLGWQTRHRSLILVKMVHPAPGLADAGGLARLTSPAARWPPEALPPSVRQFEAFQVNPQVDLA